MQEPKIIFPAWGRYGVRIELKPPNENFKNPKLMISEVKKDEEAINGWKFYMRNLNESQQSRGYYNAHCSIPVDSLPVVIAALVSIWDEVKPDDAPEFSERTREIAHKATHDEHDDDMLRESKDMGELQGPSPTPKPMTSSQKQGVKIPTGKNQDPWDAVRKKQGGPVADSESVDDSEDPKDYVPF